MSKAKLGTMLSHIFPRWETATSLYVISCYTESSGGSRLYTYSKGLGHSGH